MAMSEAGYPDVELFQSGTASNGWPNIGNRRQIPGAVWWAACDIAYEGTGACWTCWSTMEPDIHSACMAGNCANPEGPARPPKELLRRAS
jgi:hypothetical protein